MKAYTVEGKALEGITTSSGHVHVGEPGRGRMVVHVPVPPCAFASRVREGTGRGRVK